ncbi:MAG: hypothetical protein M2R45_02241 [Verrucomicrobia subdivision 3 bacterium]|nr:hypothetical protein [Limisphaerales bacterium]MCS1413973.1 hypothetical protein [Limisphaerales bacterium]
MPGVVPAGKFGEVTVKMFMGTLMESALISALEPTGTTFPTVPHIVNSFRFIFGMFFRFPPSYACLIDLDQPDKAVCIACYVSLMRCAKC